MIPADSPQLPLRFELGKIFTFDNFVSQGNEVLVALLEDMAVIKGEKQLYLWSETGLGKSHLLQAACHRAAKAGYSACYLPVEEFVDNVAEATTGLEFMDLICLDDVELLLTSSSGQELLFDFINRIREQDRGRLIISASRSTEGLGEILPDLKSRLAWGPVIQVKEMSEMAKKQALVQRAGLTGLDMPQQVLDYLLNHYARDSFSLFERLERLDKASMAMQRKLTIPFIKQVLDG